jgi:hypothetical protein
MKRRHKWKDNNEMDLTEEEYEVWTDSHSSELDPVARCCEPDDEPLVSNKRWRLLDICGLPNFRISPGNFLDRETDMLVVYVGV